MPLTIAYMRFSPRPKNTRVRKGDTTIHSIANQRSHITHYLNTMATGIDPDDVLWLEDPDASARKVPLEGRPAGKILMDAIRRREESWVIAASLDRLFRNVDDGRAVLREWQKRNVRLSLCTGVTLDVSTADGMMLATTLLNNAEYEPAKTAERLKNAADAKLARNISTGGEPPYGKELDWDGPLSERGRPANLKDNPNEQRIVTAIMAYFHRGETSSRISRKLNRDSVPFRSGKWTKRKVDQVIDRERSNQAREAIQ